MYQAIEAVCRDGQIVPLQPVRFEENETLVIVRLPPAKPAAGSHGDAQPVRDWQHHAGLLKDSRHWNDSPASVQEALRRDWD